MQGVGWGGVEEGGRKKQGVPAFVQRTRLRGTRLGGQFKERFDDGSRPLTFFFLFWGGPDLDQKASPTHAPPHISSQINSYREKIPAGPQEDCGLKTGPLTRVMLVHAPVPLDGHTCRLGPLRIVA
jgi:hypothetical protein